METPTFNDTAYAWMNNESYLSELPLPDLNTTDGTKDHLTGPGAFFAVLLPVIIVVGLIGNILSLIVFLTTGMKKQSASYYLITISVSDTVVLLSHVLVEWLKKGLPALDPEYYPDGLDYDGVCQVRHYIACVARFLSVWLIVVFTCERYIGVCHPFKKLEICSTSWSRKVILSLVLVSLLVAVYRPLLTKNEKVHVASEEKGVCTFREEYWQLGSHLDAAYGFLITVVPFVIIFVLNTLMAHKLCQRNRIQRHATHVSPDSTIKMEFTFILLALSTTFLILNLPFFIVWCVNFFNDKYDGTVNLDELDKRRTLIDALLITKSIF